MKIILGAAAAVIVLTLAVVGLLSFEINPRIDAAQQTATTAQQAANAAQATANTALANADAAHALATMANNKADAALMAIQRGDPVAIVGIVVGCVALTGFGLLVFLIWDRGEQRKQEVMMLQLRAWLAGQLPAPPYYSVETNRNVTPLGLPAGKR